MKRALTYEQASRTGRAGEPVNLARQRIDIRRGLAAGDQPGRQSPRAVTPGVVDERASRVADDHRTMCAARLPAGLALEFSVYRTG